MRVRPSYLMLAYLAFLLVGTFVPFSQTNTFLTDNYTLSIRWDYIVHFLLYMPLPVLLYAWFSMKPGGRIWFRVLWISVVVPVAFEFVQKFLPYRNFNINDMLGNLVGVVLGVALIVAFGKRITGFFSHG